MASNPYLLGNVFVKTQHFVGGAKKWTKASDTSITGHHQMRVAHQKYEDEGLTRVALKGHAHGIATVLYRKIDDVWKFAGIEWSEYDYDKIFS
jgi:scytalone dehydratase